MPCPGRHLPAKAGIPVHSIIHERESRLRPDQTFPAVCRSPGRHPPAKAGIPVGSIIHEWESRLQPDQAFPAVCRSPGRHPPAKAGIPVDSRRVHSMHRAAAALRRPLQSINKPGRCTSPRLQLHLPITAYGLRTTDYGVPTTDYGLRTNLPHRPKCRRMRRLIRDDIFFLLHQEAHLVHAVEQAVLGEAVDGELNLAPVGEH